MSEGTGSGFLDETIGAVTNLSTAGLVGFGNEGFKKGVVTEASVDGLKEVTGAAAAEDANELAREQASEAKVQADKDRANSLKQNERRQVSASRSAGRVRKGSSNTSNSGSATGGGQDALGL